MTLVRESLPLPKPHFSAQNEFFAFGIGWQEKLESTSIEINFSKRSEFGGMMKKLTRRQIFAAAAIPFIPTKSCAVGDPPPDGLVPLRLEAALKPFHPAYWPGPVSPAKQKTLGSLMQQVAAAMQDRNLPAIKDKVAALAKALGPHLGAPEELPPYGSPVEYGPPDMGAATTRLVSDYRTFAARSPWLDPVQRSTSPTSRLRTTGRAAEAMIRLHLSGLGEGYFFKEAINALDYAVSVQGPNGVFGYPYLPTGGSPVARQAAALVKQQRALGKELVHQGWIIDDLNQGGLEFDNAIIATTLLLANDVAERSDYVEAATRAGEWALQRPFVTNINYNTLNAFLLARLYRVTAQSKYLEAAKDIFRFVVLPTQLPHGRWLDPHNARIQYHAIILRHGLELLQALAQAEDPMRGAVEDCLKRGLDNLAAQIVLFGSSNADELLATETLIIGEALLGPEKLWNAAIHVDVNYLLGVMAPNLARRGLPVSPPLALFVQRASARPVGASFELSLRR